MQRHIVKAHQRQVPRSKFDRYNVTHKRTVRVNSYRRGNEKPETKPIVKPEQPKAPVDPLREKTEQIVDAKLKEIIEKTNSNKGPYWNKIATFQLDYNGKKWKVVDSYDTGGYGDYESCQLCGHKDCRYIYVIKSDGGSVLHIGSECVYNYAQDVDTKLIFRKHEKRLKESIGKTKSYRDLLVNLLLWENRNGTNSFLRDMKTRIMDGSSLTPNMVSAIRRTIAQDKPKQVIVENNRDIELFGRAKGKGANEWERGFITSVGEQLKKGYKLSIKQVAVLERIANYK